MNAVTSAASAIHSGTRWLWAAGAALLFVLLADERSLPPIRPIRVAIAGVPTKSAFPLVEDECPAGTVPDDGACVHLGGAANDGVSAPPQSNAHLERSGRLTTYEQIPKLPDRPGDYDAYRYPIPPGISGGHYVVSGYDLDRPDPQQRRGRAKHVGHGGVDLPQIKGTPVKLVALEHQEGEADVLYTGPLFGTTVITRHTLREGGRLRDYVVLFGHLDSIAAGIAPGVPLREGDLVGAVGDTGSPELVHLHLEIRRVRDGVDLAHVPAGGQLLAETVSIVCDPRNVLPLK